MQLNPVLICDGYKLDHRRQYPEGTELVYSNFTARSPKLANLLFDYDGKTVFFGLQGLCEWLFIDLWNKEFFSQPMEEVSHEYYRRIKNYLGPMAADEIGVKHIEALHKLGYLPIEIKALPEGSRVNYKVPFLTIKNTLPEFFWITNYLEDQISLGLWKSIRTATVAYEYYRLIKQYAIETGTPLEFVPFQGHDFSLRGLGSPYDAGAAAGHLLPFLGTDTLPAIDYLEAYYGANSDLEPIGLSVPATEHSVMCMGGMVDEIGTFKRLITEIYPTGIVSIVSDTWDFWRVINSYALQLKNEIMNREPDALGFAKVVFRPDSGDPVKIICGDPDAPKDSPNYKGAVECLWDVFGGATNEKGYKFLDQHVGVIYGDSITLDRCWAILAGLKQKGFASANIVFGIGSYTYQMATRDSHGCAMKATFGVVNGEDRILFKDPVTDQGNVKKSARGLLRVEKEGDDFVLYDMQTREQEQQGALETVFKDGKLVKEDTLANIRKRVLG